MRFGMSEKLGPRVFGHDHGQPFLGREFSAEPDYSDEIAREIDDEIRRIVEAAHQVAKDILSDRREVLTTISELLLKRETIEREEFEALLAGKGEEDVFGPDDATQGTPERPELPRPPTARRARRARSRAPASPAAPRKCAASSCLRSPSWRKPSAGAIASRLGVACAAGRGGRLPGCALRAEWGGTREDVPAPVGSAVRPAPRRRSVVLGSARLVRAARSRLCGAPRPDRDR